MSKPKRPTDVNQRAKFIVDILTKQIEEPSKPKNPAAVALGRLGGLKGGNARAAKLSSAKKKAIGKKAAKARWGKKD